PVEYINFEGRIPEGQYGAGEGYIWDRGNYELLERKEDKIEFYLNGQRLNGKFVLIRLKNQLKNWLLIKLS
ncbi:MAG: 3'-phosphoesterase, partial [Actinobacteria bacterium]|nr:3'-phosphoesterase [Actinomycetota bacterium]